MQLNRPTVDPTDATHATGDERQYDSALATLLANTPPERMSTTVFVDPGAFSGGPGRVVRRILGINIDRHAPKFPWRPRRADQTGRGDQPGVDDWLPHLNTDQIAQLIATTSRSDDTRVRAPGCVGVRGDVGVAGFSSDTEILTRRGWRNVADLPVSADVLVRTHDGAAEWRKVLGQRHAYFNGKLMHFAGRSVDLVVGQDHGLLARRRMAPGRFTPWQLVAAGDVYGTYNWQLSREILWLGNDAQTIWGFPAAPLLRFLGAYLGDGSCYVNKGGYVVKLAAIRERKLESHRLFIEDLGFRPNYDGKSWCFHSKSLFVRLKPLGHCDQKYIPTFIKDLRPGLLELLWEGLFASDGTQMTDTYKTTSPRLADDVQEVLYKAGAAAIVRMESVEQLNRTRYGRGRTILAKRPMFVVRRSDIHTTPKIAPRQHRLVPYSGLIHRLIVDGLYIFIRRQGKASWCGSS